MCNAYCMLCHAMHCKEYMLSSHALQSRNVRLAWCGLGKHTLCRQVDLKHSIFVKDKFCLDVRHATCTSKVGASKDPQRTAIDARLLTSQALQVN
jgi:hypothetical protein